MGVRLFVSGEIAYAADVNQFLMEQSIAKFTNISARTSAFGNGIPLSQVGGDGKPLLKEGQFCYLEDNSLASDGSGTPEVQFYNGTIWVGAENFTVADGEITDVKVNAAAAIQLSKLASGTSGQIIVANSSGVPTYVTLSGDATISNTGVITVNGLDSVALGTETTGNYVATIAGTTNQVTVSGSGVETAAVTLSLPQNIHTGASPTFAAVTATGALTGASASVSGSITAASAAISGNAVYHIATASVASAGSLSTTNDGKLVELTGNNATLTVPGTGWTAGSQVTIMQMGTGSASLTFTGATDIKATPRVSASVVALRAQYSTVTIINRGTNDWYVIGDLKS